MSYLNKPLQEYLDDLAAKKPAPGGGSAAALCGALGASLLAMVGNYSVRNKSCAGSEEKIAAILFKAEKARGELGMLVDADVAAYKALSASLKDPKKDEAALQDLYRKAADIPFEVCRLSAECLKLCSEMADCQNRNLITDTASAALILEAAFFSARFNVYVNLKFIKDMEYVGRVHGVLTPLENSLPGLKEEVLEKCEG